MSRRHDRHSRYVYREEQRPPLNGAAFATLVENPAAGRFALPAAARIAIRGNGSEPGPIAVTVGEYHVLSRPMNDGARSIVAAGARGDFVTPYPGFEVQVEVASLEWRTIARTRN